MNNSRRINSSSGSPPSVCHELQVEVAPPDARGPGVNLWTATSWPLVIATCLSCSDYRPACQKNPLALFLEPNSALVKATDRLLSVFLHRLRGSESRHRIVRALNNMLSSVTGTRSVCGVFFFFRVRDLVEISDIPFAPLGRAVDDSLMGFLRNNCRGMFFFFSPRRNLQLSREISRELPPPTSPSLCRLLPRPALRSGFLGATAAHALANSAAPNAILNSLNSSMSPLQTQSPSNAAPSPSLWPSALTSTQGTDIFIYANSSLFLRL